MLANTRITLLISGSIAAYKTAELVREFKKLGAIVRVAMSKSAQQFVSPLVLQTLSQERVYTDLFSLEDEREIGHIALADTSDIIISAPSSANILAKVAHGISDDLLSTVILAARCPVIFFPAMNVNMWENPITQRNVQTLVSTGYRVVTPERGELACGWTGSGRLPELSTIVEEVHACLSPKPLKRARVIVTAGPTIESLDPVRYLGNRSSGKMGYALARVAYAQGAEVTLISGPSNQRIPTGVRTVFVESAEEMREAVFSESCQKREGLQLQLICMAAAVSDHKPLHYSKDKIKKDKSKNYTVEFTPSPDILSQLGSSRLEIEKKSEMRLLIVGFAAETGNEESLVKSAREKLTRKSVDLVVGNFAEESLGQNDTRVWLVTKQKDELIGVADKHTIAEKIIEAALVL